MNIDPASGFAIVWCFLGTGIYWIFRAIGIPRALTIGYLFALVPAILTAAYLSQTQ